MKNRKKTRFLWLAILGGIALASPLCKKATGGLTMAKLHGEISLPTSNIEQIFPPLSTKFFTYLGRGAQSYSFSSADGDYVLKIFSQHAGRTPLARFAPLLPKRTKRQVMKTAAKRRSRMERALKSYQLAFEEMREETGLVYLHLSKTCAPLPVTLTDKIGIQHEVDLSSMLFVIQKKAKLTYPTLRIWAETGEIGKAKEGIRELVSLLKIRCQKGLADQDANLKTNFGFLDTRAIQFDPGRYRRDKTKADPDVYSIDLIRYTDRMGKWLGGFSPELASFLHEEVGRASCDD